MKRLFLVGALAALSLTATQGFAAATRSITADTIKNTTGGSAIAVPSTGANIVTDTGTQTLTNKTLTAPAISSPTGLTKSDVGLSNVDNTSDANKPVSTATQTALNGKVNTSAVGANNGVAGLDAGGKVPAAQLPNSIMEYQGTWNANTNSPSLADGSGNAGDVYIATVAGTQNLGSGNITFTVGDWAIYNGTIWEKSINSNAVVSVNSQTGVVTLTKSDVGLSNVDNTSDATKNSASATLTNKTINGNNNTLTVLAASQLSGAVPIANGGTGQTSASGAINALVPTQTGHSGEVLTTNGSVVSWAASGGANTALSNLSSVAVNADILPGASGTIGLGSPSLAWSAMHANTVSPATDTALTVKTNDKSGGQPSTVVVKGGDYTGTSSGTRGGDVSVSGGAGARRGGHVDISGGAGDTRGGDVHIYGGSPVTSGVAGQINILSGTSPTATSGAVSLQTGDPATSIASGAITLSTGQTTDAASGQVDLFSGAASGTGNSGGVNIGTGSTVDGTSGDLTLSVGSESGSGSRGKINLVDGSLAGASTGHVWTLTNTSTGAGEWAAAPTSVPSITGSQASPTAITAGGGVTFSGTNYINTKYIQGSGGPVTVTANPQIAAATNVGQRLRLICTSATNTVTFADGTGLSLNGPLVCGDNSAIDLDWNGSVWTEVSRR